MSPSPRHKTLVLACGALARELLDIHTLHELTDLTVDCLPAGLHNHPDRIPHAVRERVRRDRHLYDRILIGYADCGTGGLLDTVCEEEDVERLPGAHCYEFFAGAEQFAALADDQPGTFYLTDYLARHFERLIWEGFGIAAHPELRDMMFGNYTRVVFLAQSADAAAESYARRAAEMLQLPLEIIDTGYGELTGQVVDFVRSPSTRTRAVSVRPRDTASTGVTTS